MKPEDFHIYKERAFTGNPWLYMDIEQQMEVMKRLERGCIDDMLIRVCEENLKKNISFEKVYIVPARSNGKTEAMKILDKVFRTADLKGE